MGITENYWEDFSLTDRPREQWVPVIEYEGLYEASSLGRFKAVEKTVKAPDCAGGRITRKAKILKLNLKDNGYWHITFCKEGKSTTFLAHRVTALHFVPKVRGKPRINHKDTIKHHGWASNLEWCTDSENQVHAYDNGLCRQDGEHHATKKLNWTKVREIRSLHKSGVSSFDLAKRYNIHFGHVNNIVAGLYWKENL